MTGKRRRDEFTLEATGVRKRVLEMVLMHVLDNGELSDEEQAAYNELAHDGLVHGEFITGRGHAAAEAWGLIK